MDPSVAAHSLEKIHPQFYLCCATTWRTMQHPAIKIKTRDERTLIINIYMLTNSPNNIAEVIHILWKIEALVADNVTCVLMAGRNANPRYLFANELVNFCQEFDYVINNKEILDDVSYTY